MLKNMAFYFYVCFIACGIFLFVLAPVVSNGFNLGSSDISRINSASEHETYPLETAPQSAQEALIDIDWQSADSLFSIDSTALAIDVKSGIKFSLTRIGGSLHADVRPTAERDKTLVSGMTQGGGQNRPLVLQIAPHTWACASLSPIAHTDSDGQSHFCLYFKKSRAHSTGLQDYSHEKAIKYAQKYGHEVICDN